MNEQDDHVSRRRFLKVSAAAVTSLPALGALLGCNGAGAQTPEGGSETGSGSETGGETETGTETGPETVQEACVETGDDIQGPFYRPDALFSTEIAEADEPGTRILIRGTVFGPDCETPLVNAIVDVWHADDDGRYDNNDADQPDDPSEFRLRAQMRTDARGRYEYTSIMPGRYLNGPQYRPAHIHYKVRSEGHAELTTQIYFEGDEFIPVDNWASNAESSRIIAMTDEGGVSAGEFDIVLG
jgi:protocatechuate 3,4-dioxygenase beta subunit